MLVELGATALERQGRGNRYDALAAVEGLKWVRRVSCLHSHSPALLPGLAPSCLQLHTALLCNPACTVQHAKPCRLHQAGHHHQPNMWIPPSLHTTLHHATPPCRALLRMLILHRSRGRILTNGGLTNFEQSGAGVLGGADMLSPEARAQQVRAVCWGGTRPACGRSISASRALGVRQLLTGKQKARPPPLH